MPSDADILQRVQKAFARCRRPEHYGDFTHCEECAEADELFRSRDVHTLSIKDVGLPGGPICFISPEGFTYYLPALVRLALDAPDDFYGWYGGPLFSQLCSDGQRNARFLACTPEQRRVVVEVLHHLAETRASLADTELCTDELFKPLRFGPDEISIA
jgi:hypothetical protein